ncbi:hypothetical protein DH2020_010742 [Rehmannia glutinosa]|uniref:Phytocyanin domain-containing protein n=1 Tax=Rehmannia glutinosa TaxID=99300 RepID=A0ABR0XBH9_REHGL
MGYKIVFIGLLIALSSLVIGCGADTYSVGNDMGWTVPPGGDSAYRNWAAREDFELGDQIIFRWIGTHNVVQVTREGYDNCSATNYNMTLSPVHTSSPTTFTLNSTAPHYFICTVDSHCRLGQRVTVQIGSSAATPSLIKTGAFLSTILMASISLLI